MYLVRAEVSDVDVLEVMAGCVEDKNFRAYEVRRLEHTYSCEQSHANFGSHVSYKKVKRRNVGRCDNSETRLSVSARHCADAPLGMRSQLRLDPVLLQKDVLGMRRLDCTEN